MTNPFAVRYIGCCKAAVICGDLTINWKWLSWGWQIAATPGEQLHSREDDCYTGRSKIQERRYLRLTAKPRVARQFAINVVRRGPVNADASRFME